MLTTMKKLLYLLLLLLAGVSAPHVLRAQAQNTVWWGYWNTSMPLQPTTAAATGTTTCGIRLTTANRQLVDGTIHGLRFWLADKSVVRRAYVWVSQRTFTDGRPDMAMKEIPLDDLRDLAHDGAEPTVARFDTPVDVLPSTNRYASAYVGYTIETSASCALVAGGSGLAPDASSCYVGWERQEGRYGPLALQLEVSGMGIAENEVSISPLSETIAMAGEKLSLPFSFTLNGSRPVESIDCRVAIDGEWQPLQHFAFDTPIDELGMTLSRTLTVDVPAEARTHDCTVALGAINGLPFTDGGAVPGDAHYGEADQLPPGVTPSQHFSLIALSRRPLKRTVMEELTGTWCPNCPRGIVGIERLEQRFADRFVPIAIHGGDSNEPMRVADYDGSAFVKGVSAAMGGRPSCSFDRVANGDPYWGVGNGPHFGADIVVGYLLNEPCVADVSVSAAWNGLLTDQVDCDVATTFRYTSDTDAHYAIMLVLTADSLTGEGSEWLQVNKLAGQTGLDDDLSPFTQGERYMSMAYNHVAIAVKGVETGIDGSVTAPFADGVAQHYHDTFSTAGNTLVQRRDCLHVVAMLIDTQTRQVVNVAKASVQSPTQAIDGVTRSTTDGKNAYDVGGRRLTKSGKGIGIEGGRKVLH